MRDRLLIAWSLVLWTIGVATIGRIGILYAAMFTMSTGVVPVAWGPGNLRLSLWYTGPVLAILAAHEGGHWLAARHHRVRTWPPVLFPWPSSWSTALPWVWLPTVGVLGGFLRLRTAPPSRVAQWDIAFCGVASGFAVTLACSVIGALWSPPLSLGEHTMSRFWSPRIVRVLVGDRMAWHPLLMAARIGWCLTVVSLLPVPPFDGGRLYWIIPSIWPARRWAVCALGAICLCCWA